MAQHVSIKIKQKFLEKFYSLKTFQTIFIFRAYVKFHMPSYWKLLSQIENKLWI